MKLARNFLLILLIPVFLFILFSFLTKDVNWQLLNPQGIIAQQQSLILYGALVLSAIIGLPIIFITFIVVFHYREGNSKAKHSPDWSSSKALTALWWIVPTIFILLLSITTWKTAHKLDPYKPIESAVKPITIQVVALRWKWLFIYPEQKIATVNYIEIPEDTPINFQLTADAPMNSFWIPSLAGQIYAMNGMTTKLHIMASEQGEFPGYAAEVNGDGFSGMRFMVKSTTPENFESWVNEVQTTGGPLSSSTYEDLVEPSEYHPRAYYYYVDENLYNEIVNKYKH